MQFVPGAGNEVFARWMDLYRRIQASGKSIFVSCFAHEIEQVMETLDPHGVYLYISDCPTREVGEEIIKRLVKWSARYA